MEPPSYGLSGLRLSLGRIRAATSDDDILTGVAEVLMWLKSLEDWNRGALGDTDYFDERSRDEPGGQTLAGLMWCRNAVQHDLMFPAAMLELHPSETLYPSKTLQPGKQWLWKQADEVSTASDEHDRDRRYEQWVAGKPVREPLFIASRFIEHITDHPEGE